ncbi:MAG: alpha/beta fold hydrolase [Candidatus Levyibacteriota bacterium]
MSRPLLVLLPGLVCDASVWAAQREALGDRVDTFVADYGDADSLTQMGKRTLAQIPATRFALAGHSMGGRIALEIMRLAPERVERLALLDTGATPLPAGEAGERERAGRLALLALARKEGMRAMAREWARGMVHTRRVGGPVYDAVLDMFERRSPEIFAAQIAALLARPDARPLLPGIRVPTLVLTGREDSWAPPEQHEAIQRAIPGSRLVVVDDCGHMSPMEQPDAVSRAFGEWLGQPARA